MGSLLNHTEAEMRDGEPSATFSRRAALVGAAGLSLAATLPKAVVAAPPPIDVHHHFVPPFYKAAAEAWYRNTQSAVAPVMDWSPDVMLAGLDHAGYCRAVLSLSTPATTIAKGTEAVVLARRCNDYAAELVRTRPGQLTFFVTLPMPDVAASITEADRALRLPGAAGVALLTSYDGRYLGDPSFEPLLHHLNARKQVAFVHPTVGACCIGLTPAVPTPLIEFPVDTARAIGTLIWSGSLARYSDIKFIFSHGGGAIAMLTQRLQLAASWHADAQQRVPDGIAAMMQNIHVDTASASHAAAITAARAQFGERNILFGSDAPWGTVDRSLAALDQLNLEPELLSRIRQGNARALIGALA